MPALPSRISDATTQLLKSLRVDIRTKSKATEVSADGVQLADGGFIPSELVIWSAGVKGPDVLSHLDGLETNPIGQLAVTPTLQTTLIPIFLRSAIARPAPSQAALATSRRGLRPPIKRHRILSSNFLGD